MEEKVRKSVKLLYRVSKAFRAYWDNLNDMEKEIKVRGTADRVSGIIDHPKRFDEAICGSCKKPIRFNGSFWEHKTYTPRHPASPSVFYLIGQEFRPHNIRD